MSHIKIQDFEINGRKVAVKNKHKCPYCLKVLNHGNITRDHIIPRSTGLLKSPFNIVFCCRECNNDKGNTSMLEFLGFFEHRSKKQQKQLVKILYSV